MQARFARRARRQGRNHFQPRGVFRTVPSRFFLISWSGAHLRPVTTVQTEVLRATSVGGESHLYRDRLHASGVYLLPGDIPEHFRARLPWPRFQTERANAKRFEFSREASAQRASKCQSLATDKMRTPRESPRRSADRKDPGLFYWSSRRCFASLGVGALRITSALGA